MPEVSWVRWGTGAGVARRAVFVAPRLQLLSGCGGPTSPHPTPQSPRKRPGLATGAFWNIPEGLPSAPPWSGWAFSPALGRPSPLGAPVGDAWGRAWGTLKGLGIASSTGAWGSREHAHTSTPPVPSMPAIPATPGTLSDLCPCGRPSLCWTCISHEREAEGCRLAHLQEERAGAQSQSAQACGSHASRGREARRPPEGP